MPTPGPARTGALLRAAPLDGRYGAAVAMALLALSPFIVLSTATSLVEQDLLADLGTDRFGVQLSSGLANAGYALGAVVAADLIRRLPARRVFLGCEAAFAAASLAASVAPDVAVFTVGRSVQGLATGMLLVAALPPLVTQHGVRELPRTAAFIDLGLFGMVTLGPAVGGLAASGHAWRVLFAAAAALGVVGLGLGTLAFGRTDAPDPGIGFDFSAIPVAALATVLPFLGVSWLSRGTFTSPGFWLPLAVGLAALVTLVVRQYRKREALMPVTIIANTLPVTGIVLAMVAGAVFTTLVELVTVDLVDVRHLPPVEVGALLATQLVGVVVAATLFRVVIVTRWLPALAFGGAATVGVGGALALLLGVAPTLPVVAVAGLLLGFGAGAGVAPGLFMGGLSAPSSRLGPTFALVELLRSEAAFVVAPVVLAVAMATGDPAAGVRVGVLVALGVLAAGMAAAAAVLLLGGVRPHAPDLDTWIEGERPAYHSPRLFAVVRDRARAHDPA